MLIIEGGAALARALETPMHPQLKALLRLRRGQLLDDGFADVSGLIRFLCICPGDALAAVEEAAGFPLTQDGEPTFEWCLDHGAILEAPVILSDDGSGFVLFVLNDDRVDPALIDLLRTHASTASLPQSG